MAKVKKAEPAKTKKTATPTEAKETRSGVSDYLRFGESYTSLILGIIVVIIATALLLSFVNNKDASNTPPPVSEQVQNIAISEQPLQLTPGKPEATQGASAQEEAEQEPTKAPTAAPTQVPTKQPTVQPAAPTKAQEKEEQGDENEWIVQEDETLWDIAEQHYESGYNWVDIARANNLSNPGTIHPGNKLILPDVKAKQLTIVQAEKEVVKNEQKKTPEGEGKIEGGSYKVAQGDTLWSIAVRAYGDGYKWVDIARENKLANPDVVHPGNTLKLPRK